MTSGASDDPPIPQSTKSVRALNFAASASKIGNRSRDVSSRSTQLSLTAASVAAAGPQVVASLAANRGWAAARVRYSESVRSTLLSDSPLKEIIYSTQFQFLSRSHLG